MKSSALPIALVLALQGCASTQQQQASTIQEADPSAPRVCRVADGTSCMLSGTNEMSDAMLHTTKVGTHGEAKIRGSQIATAKGAPPIEGQPLTSVVVTQCNLVVAVYMTMPDGRLLRFDQRAEVPAEDLVAVAYTASSSERVEVACEGVGVKGFETHKPI